MAKRNTAHIRIHFCSGSFLFFVFHIRRCSSQYCVFGQKKQCCSIIYCRCLTVQGKKHQIKSFWFSIGFNKYDIFVFGKTVVVYNIFSKAIRGLPFSAPPLRYIVPQALRPLFNIVFCIAKLSWWVSARKLFKLFSFAIFSACL